MVSKLVRLHYSYYENGQIEILLQYKNAKKVRESHYTYYENGQEEEKITKWHESGNKKSEGIYKTQQKEGKWNEWHESGNKKSEGIYKNNKKEGKWNEWDENGQIEFEGNYEDGKKIGEMRYQYAVTNKHGIPLPKNSGTVLSMATWKGASLVDRKIFLYHTNGQKAIEGYAKGEDRPGFSDYYIHAYKYGKWTWWYENGQIEKEGSYRNQSKCGKWTTWYDNGEIDEVYVFNSC